MGRYIQFIVTMVVILCEHCNIKVSACGGNIRKNYGVFTSPNYPNVYPDKLNCHWNITVAPGLRLQLNFTQFEIEYNSNCEYDYVEVVASNGTLGKFCGSRKMKKHEAEMKAPSLRKPIMSKDNTLVVTLKTDYSNENKVRGFEAHFKAMDINECQTENGGCSHYCHNVIGGSYCSCKIGYKLAKDRKQCLVLCHYIVQAKSGYITTPEFPSSYPPRSECEWHIVARKGFFIHLELLEFHIEDHHSSICPYDYLLIEDEKKKVGPYCGTKIPPKFTSFSNWMIVEFQSDKSESFKGFKARYWLEGIKCPTLRAPENGKMFGPTNFSVWETVKFECHEAYRIYGSKERTCLSNGTWTGTQPNCTRVICENPWRLLPENGMAADAIGGEYYFNHRLDIRCDYFHDISGSEVMYCQRNGSWSGGDAVCVRTCGRTIVNDRKIEQCSVGRHRAKTFSLLQPWLVAIKYRGKLICSGMLINSEWILSSTHCIKDKAERFNKKGHLEVILGTQNHDELGEGAVKRKVKKVVVGQRFDYGFHSDLTLIKLESPVSFTRFIQPICLPEGKRQKHFFRHGKPVATVGWLVGGPKWITDRCETMVHKSKCMEYVKKTHIRLHKGVYGDSTGRRNLIPKDILCTNASVGLPDMCKIYPGSGLVRYDKNVEKWYLGGILSWGTLNSEHCKQYVDQFPIYTKVYKYIRWIKEHTRIKNLRHPDISKYK